MDFSALNGAMIAVFAVLGLVYLVILLVMVAAAWKLFTKAGKPGWAAIVPIYNMVVFLEIVGKPIWWIILMFIPFVSFVVGIILALELAKVFGKSAGFGIGLVLFGPIFLPILAFGSAQYQGAGVPQMRAPMPAY